MAKTQILRLPDGRRLAYDDHGPADGHPLFYFHGAPSARVEPAIFDLPALVERLGIRLIAADRPGLGLSDFQPGRRLGDWPAAVRALADHLKLGHFAVLGYSGGGPYALACALRLPDRLTAVGVVSCVGPHDVPGLTDGTNPDSLRFMRLSLEKPWLADLVTRGMALTARLAPGRMAAQAISALPAPDAAVMADPARGLTFARLVAEAARRGPRGPRHDTALMVWTWDIDPAAIRLPVHLWHGEEDQNAPVAMGRYLADRIPNAIPRILSGEGHLSLMVRHAETILTELTRPAEHGGEASLTIGRNT